MKRKMNGLTWLLLGTFAALPVASQEATRPVKRVDLIVPTAIQYGKKWAVIIGANYAEESRKNLGQIAKLKNAENDAAEVSKLLQSHYGFGKEEIFDFIGEKAVCQDIRRKIFTDLRNKIGPDDSFLFYFSGHGHRDGEEGYLLPNDVDMKSEGDDGKKTNSPVPTSCIEMTELVRFVKERCKARHKLLILDCCYSGAVFSVDGKSTHSASAFERYATEIFKVKGSQAITASRGFQESADGVKSSNGTTGHSPFTMAFLNALNSLPPYISEQRYFFTARELFGSMMNHFEASQIEQTPLCRWLDAEQGEYHFFPAPARTFADPSIPGDSRRLLAMTPTTFGNWWADEVPWFMPSLRLEILKNVAATRSGFAEINAGRLKQAAMDYRLEFENCDSDLKKKRVAHLEKLLNPSARSSREHVLMEIVADLKELCSDKNCDPADLHFLAVLQHKLGHNSEARNYYANALKCYRDKEKLSTVKPLTAEESASGKKAPAAQKGSADIRMLRILCQVDYGVFLLNVANEYQEAASNFYEARQEFPIDSPGPFRVFTLCREADAFRKLGRWGLSDERMKEATGLLTNEFLDSKETHPISAATWKQNGWAFMEQWRFSEAQESFEKAKSILGKEQESYQKAIDDSHVQHGLSMVKRFLGKDREALKSYRDLTPNIAAIIRKLEKDADRSTNYGDIRFLLFDRLVNSLERQADCSMFGAVPDFAEAGDDYRRALEECINLSEDKRRQIEPDLLYRRAIALSLSAESSDLELAAELCRNAVKMENGSQDLPVAPLGFFKGMVAAPPGKSSSTIPLKTKIVKRLALTLIACFKEKRADLADETDNFFSLAKELQKERRVLDRDELERLMFGFRMFIRHGDALKFDRFSQIESLRSLLSMCRKACTEESRDPGLLAYLRPYYEEAFLAHKLLQPKHAKELVQIAFEATTGKPYDKPPEMQTLLVMFWAGSECHVIFDQPRGKSASYCLDEIRSLQELQDRVKTFKQLTLPDVLRMQLCGCSEKEAVVVRWRDPVHQFGYRQRLSTFAGAGPTPTKNDQIALELDASGKIPFGFPAILQENQIREDEFTALMFRRPASWPILTSDQASVSWFHRLRGGRIWPFSAVPLLSD